MSRKTRTIKWCEGRILEILGKRQEIQTEALRNTQEEHNLEIALAILISKKEIIREKDDEGITVYNLVA